MSSHVTSIEDDWTKFKQKAFDFEENSNQINSEVRSDESKRVLIISINLHFTFSDFSIEEQHR